MKIKPIKTMREYEAALKRIDSLMLAKSGSSEEIELGDLAIRVWAYEEKLYPLTPPDTLPPV
jgi:HTH-type transcriptional regulator/antitoxin HigA